MNGLAHYYAAAAAAFHEIFYYKFPENFSRNYSGKVPLFSRKFPEKFEISGNFRTHNPIWATSSSLIVWVYFHSYFRGGL